MSIFSGRIEELENILIDNFLACKSHTCFFLSHCHTDHMAGLDQLFSNGSTYTDQKIYCSPISRLILLNKYNTAHENFIKELTGPELIIVPGSNDTPSYQVTVTPIPAGHCPGSVMFLFETVNRTFLYTGDFRISKSDVSKFRALHSKNQIKSIDKIYFDSTFFNDIYWNFPCRSEVVLKLIDVIEKWISKSPDHHIMLEISALFGYEYVFVELARILKCKIHVKNSYYDLFYYIPEVGSFLTKDCHSTKVHAFASFDKKCCPCHNERLFRIKLSAQWYKSTERNRSYKFWKKISKRKILLCYSTHCSCSELIYFLNYLQPKNLEPFCVAVGSTIQKTKAYTEQVARSWLSCSPERSSEHQNADFPLENNYKFRVIFPERETDISKNEMEFTLENEMSQV